MVLAMKTKQQIVPTHPAWTHSGLRERISWRSSAARQFAATVEQAGAGKALSADHANTYCRAVRTILLIVLVLLLIGVFPGWGYSSGWGYKPFGGIGLVLLIIIILAVMGKL
jgi:hypothetical protein